MDHQTQLAWFEMFYPSMTPSTEPGTEFSSTLNVEPQPQWEAPTSSYSNSNHTTLPAGVGFQEADVTFVEPPSYSSFDPPMQNQATMVPVAPYDSTNWPIPRNYHPVASNELPPVSETSSSNGVNTWNMGFRHPLPLPRQDKLSQPRPTKTPPQPTTRRPAVKSSRFARTAIDNQVRAPLPKSSNLAPHKERPKFLKLLKQTLVGLYPQCRNFEELLLVLDKDTAEISQRMPPSYLDSTRCEIGSHTMSGENAIHDSPEEKPEIFASQMTSSHSRGDRIERRVAEYVDTADIPWRPLETTTSDIEAEDGGAVSELKGYNSRRLACPYYKKTPSLHQTRRSCKGPGFLDVHRLKLVCLNSSKTIVLIFFREHIYRYHELQNICNRCCTRFSSEEELQRHSRLTVSCKPAPFTAQGCSQAQKSQLMRRTKTKGRTEAEKWKEIYLVLFPDASEVPSPCKTISVRLFS
jgi:hypothetical protein